MIKASQADCIRSLTLSRIPDPSVPSLVNLYPLSDVFVYQLEVPCHSRHSQQQITTIYLAVKSEHHICLDIPTNHMKHPGVEPLDKNKSSTLVEK